MSDIVIEAIPEDGYGNESRACYTKMLQRILFNISLVRTGFCKTLIKDMGQSEYDEYIRLLQSLEQMALNKKPT